MYNVHRWQNWRPLKAEDVGLGRALFRGNMEMLPTSDMMRFVCSGWNMDAEKCSACGVYLFRLFICSFKTRASIQFLYTVQLCMLQGKFQEFKYIVIYCIATLFLTKHWHWVRITMCGQLTGDMMTSWSNPSLAKVYDSKWCVTAAKWFSIEKTFFPFGRMGLRSELHVHW